VFQDYHLRVGEIVADMAPPAGGTIIEQRLDETEIGRAKFVTLTELQQVSGMTAAALPEWLSLDRYQADLINYDVFASIYNAGKLALLASWRDRPSAEKFSPPVCAGVRHRVVRVVRDYGMFDRRESPQYYPRSRSGRRRRARIPNLWPSGRTRVLELRPNCECCNKDLPPEAADAVMCSFECIFCRTARRRRWVGAARIAAANWWLVPDARPRSWRPGSCPIPAGSTRPHSTSDWSIIAEKARLPRKAIERGHSAASWLRSPVAPS
jgi:hypothetical protein